MSKENDKYQQGYRFKVTIDEIEAADFTEASGLTVQKEVLEYNEGGENTRHHKLVGATRFSNIVLRRGTSDSAALFEWVKQTIDGVVKRKNGSIIAVTRAGDPIARWDFKNAWPCRYEGPQFRSGESEIAIELIELAHDGFEMKTG
jgi:phage tail-like protein